MSTIMRQEPVETKKRHHLRSLLIAMVVFAAYTIHVIAAKGSFDFLIKLLQGDIIYIANLVMTVFVLAGWFLVYKYLGKLL